MADHGLSASELAPCGGETALGGGSNKGTQLIERHRIQLTARILLALPFLISGLGKLGAYTATAAYMASAGVPGVLLPLVIATEVLGTLAIALGWKTRVIAFLLAGFSLLTALTFHRNFADPAQMVNFLKNVCIAGGFPLIVVNGAGPLSIDRRFAR